MEEHDFIVIGAGLSGIDAGYRLKTELPDCSYTILEARDKIGGTWSFFKFPGIRSDSQLTTFGLPWRPWVHDKDMADGPLILEYIESAAHDEGIDKKIRFRHKVTAANWSSEEQRWTLTVDNEGSTKIFRAKFLFACSGYYDYEKPLQAEIPGLENFQGTVAHPQFWPTGLNYAGKRVVIIGSGATAITLLPVMAKTAGHVTMLQRSPSYVMTLPSVSVVGNWLKQLLPARIAHPLNWWRCFITEQGFSQFCLAFPNAARKLILRLMKQQLPEHVPVDPHFNPRYVPMDQRLCFCPDGDFFKALHRANCDVVTDVIETVTADGILTKSGKLLEADILVTATGLDVRLFGGASTMVDGVPVEIGQQYVWRGCMLTGIPNAGAVIGYTTSSWTLGADACIRLLIQVYKRTVKIGATSAVPTFDETTHSVVSKPVVGHSSTYFVRARNRLPRITGENPWYGRLNPIYDYWQLWFGSLTRGMKYVMPSKKIKCT
ncbi:monooxygenase [Pseudomassariella vexata]|uniref:Monooxygenase n=1 Tax=Pseudomassariella vexata TaxID=1141098 RepID=A0A1Y2D9E5_9PEZI|nr:monooxygenase [Pseudomassariella vexata]ORY55882.1 monooxygenase [Pseudomassariella vexata]